MDYFDCHADTLTKIPLSEDLWENTCNLDLKRVRKFADKYTQIFAIWKDRAEIAGGLEQQNQIFWQLYQRAVQLLQAQSEYLVWCRDALDMQAAHRAGKAAAFLSIEDISLIPHFYSAKHMKSGMPLDMGSFAEYIRKLGFRFAMLTWNYENVYGCGAAADQSKGLTKEGRALVKELLGQRIVLDISHLSDQGAEDIFHMTDQPVMASHSNVRDVCSHPRNLKKEHLRELVRRGGLVGINFYKYFTGEQPQITDLLRHMDAVLDLGGADILAIGSDFDGCGNEFPQGITEASSVPYLKSILEREGFGSSLIEKIFFGNAERFLLQNVN